MKEEELRIYGAGYEDGIDDLFNLIIDFTEDGLVEDVNYLLSSMKRNLLRNIKIKKKYYIMENVENDKCDT